MFLELNIIILIIKMRKLQIREVQQFNIALVIINNVGKLKHENIK